MKKILAILLCLSLALAFTACGGKGNESYPVEGLGDWERMTDNTDDIDVTIVNAGIGQEWINNMAQAYEDDTGVHVNVSFAEDSAIQSHFSADRESVYSDLYLTFSSYSWLTWAGTGKLYSLDEAVGMEYNDGTTIDGKMYDMFDNYGIYNGSRYILQLTYAPTGFVYNVDYLAELGYSEFPDTWDGLIQLCSDILASDLTAGSRKVMPLSFGGSVDDLNNTFRTLWAQQDPDAYQEFFNYDSSAGAPQGLLSDERLHALEAIYDLLAPKNGYSTTTLEGAASDTHINSETWFLLGYTAFCPTGAWFETEISSVLRDSEVNYAFAPVPALTDPETDQPYEQVLDINLPTEYFCIPAKCSNPEGAADLLRYMCHSVNLQKIHEMTGMPLAFDYDMKSLDLNEWQRSVTDAISEYRNVYALGYSDYYAVGALRTTWYKSTNPVLQILNDKVTRDELYDQLKEEYDFRESSWEDYTDIIGSLAAG